MVQKISPVKDNINPATDNIITPTDNISTPPTTLSDTNVSSQTNTPLDNQPNPPRTPSTQSIPIQQTPPPPPPTPHTDTADSTPSAPFSGDLIRSGRRRRLKIIIISAIILLLLMLAVFVGITLTGAISALPILNPTQKIALMRLTSSLPVIPKSNSQITLETFEASPHIDSYQNDLTGSAKVISKTILTPQTMLELNLDLETIIDLFETDNPQGSFKGSFQFNFPFLSALPSLYSEEDFPGIEAAIEVKYKDQNLYFILNKLTGLDDYLSYSDFNLDLFLGRWFSVAMDELGSEWVDILDSTTGGLYSSPFYTYPSSNLQALQEEMGYQIVLSIIGNGLMDEMKREKDENIGGRASWHLSLSKEERTLKRFLYKAVALVPEWVDYLDDEYATNSYSENYDLQEAQRAIDNFLKYFNDLEIHLYIDQQMKYISGFAVNAEINFDEAPSILGIADKVLGASSLSTEGQELVYGGLESFYENITLQISFESYNTNINQRANITPPNDHTDFLKYYEENIESIAGERISKARDAGMKSDVGMCATALEAYYTDNLGLYPATLNELVTEDYLVNPCDGGEGRPTDIFPAPNQPMGYKTLDGRQEAVLYIQLESPDDKNLDYYVYDTQYGMALEMSRQSLVDLIGTPLIPTLTPTPTPSSEPLPTPTPPAPSPTSSSSFKDLLE